jgi:hypothetical protein
MTTALKKSAKTEVESTTTQTQGREFQPEKPIMEYNKKTWQSWMNLQNHIPDIEDKIPHGVEAPQRRKKEFIAQVDLEQGPIERKVMSIVRFKAKNRDDKKQKEYLRYHEDWQAKDWMGRKIRNSENIEGVYYEQEEEKIIKYDETKGPYVSGYRRSGEHPVYTIPYSKEAVDQIVGNQDKSDIIFTVRTSERRQHFTYDEFVNYSWEKLENILLLDGGAEEARVYRYKQDQGNNIKTANNLDFKPS